MLSFIRFNDLVVSLSGKLQSMTIELNPQLRLVVADCEKQINVDDGKKHTKKKGDKSRICAPSKHLRIKEANPRPVRSQCIDNVAAAAAVVGEKNEEKKKKKKKKTTYT